MFYYPAVLKHHSGCFSTIWLVATKGIRVPRRDFLKVNVKRTCDDIMNYVLERVPPPQPGLPRPRFSLYLSSQLQYGVVVVYHRQCAILLEEIHTIVGQLVKKRACQKIDMDDASKQPLALPDVLALLEETEGALDPLFGVMDMQSLIPSPSALPQMHEEYLREASPEHPELTSPTSAVEQRSDLTASQESITLRETEPVVFSAPEYEGEELVDEHPGTIDFLLAERDDFPGEAEIAREEVTVGEEEREIERRREETRVQEIGVSTTTSELQPTTLVSDDATLLPPEESEASEEMPGPPPVQVTPVSVSALPSPPSVTREREQPSLKLEDVSPPPAKTRKRQLTFFDPETQISQDVLQQQINNPLTETRRPVLPQPSFHSAADLLNNPCTFLPEAVESLWRPAATVTPLPSSDLQVGERGPESTDSEKEREREMIELTEREEARPEISPREVERELAEAEMIDMSALGALPFDSSDHRELSREMLSTTPSEREGSIVSRSVSTLQDIPEVVGDSLEQAATEPSGLMPELHEEQETEPVLFRTLLPPEAVRRTVSGAFHRLLQNLSARRVRAEQDEPYGDILILPRRNRGEVRLSV